MREVILEEMDVQVDRWAGGQVGRWAGDSSARVTSNFPCLDALSVRMAVVVVMEVVVMLVVLVVVVVGERLKHASSFL